jgi:hypothetical protein
MDIIRFGYGEEFAVDGRFDLNNLRALKRVKTVGDKYIPDYTKKKSLEILLDCTVTYEEEEIEKVVVEDIKREKDQYSRWWNEEKTKTRKLSEELKCAKLEIEALKKEDKE